MRIGLVTICDMNNYGNRLQNYALSTALTRLGHDVTTLNFYPENRPIPMYKKGVRYLIHRATGYRLSGNPDYWKGSGKRRFVFKRFTKAFVPTRWSVDPGSVENDYDLFVLGGDQVWNPNFWRGEAWGKQFLLSFVKQKRKVAYSCSFGISEIPAEWRDLFRTELLNFYRLSVREQQGKVIAEELTGRSDVQVVVDPVMLLGQDEWKRFAQKPEKAPEGDYLFCFFLGLLPEDQRKQVETFAEVNRLEVVDLMDPDRGLASCSPPDFVWLIEHASLVLTDSFHVSVVSFLFDRPFRVLERITDASASTKDMYSRFETLSECFGLRQNLLAWDDLPELDGSVLDEHVPRAAYDKLSEARAEAFRFLTEAIDS